MKVKKSSNFTFSMADSMMFHHQGGPILNGGDMFTDTHQITKNI